MCISGLKDALLALCKLHSACHNSCTSFPIVLQRYVNRKFYRERNNPIVINKDMDGKDDRFAWKGHKEDKEERRPSKGGGGGAKNEPGTGIIFARGVDKDGKPQLFVRGP